MTKLVRAQRLWELDPEWGHAPWRAAPTRVERVLHVHLNTPAEPQTSLCNALASLATHGGYCRVDWSYWPTVEQRHQAVVEAAARLKPTVVFMQLQRPDVLAPSTVAEIRRVCAAEDVVIASWCGDVGGCNGPSPAPGEHWAYELAPHCDLMLYSSMSQVRAHRSRGMHNAAYLQIGYDEYRYFEGPDAGYGSRYDIVFLGTKCEEGHWSNLPANDVRLRTEVVETLRSERRERFGLFGSNWADGVSEVAPAESGEAYRTARLALSVSVCSNLERYSSGRLFRALACGAPVLMKRFADWGSFGLLHERNVLAWDTLAGARALVQRWLGQSEEAREMGRAGAQLAREHHSWGIRMLELYPLIVASRAGHPTVGRPW
jgi:hypothetical protein